MRKLTGCLAAMLLVSAASAWAEGTDELWEMKMSMEMSGMNMPASTSTSCIAKGDHYNPETDQLEKNCRMTDYAVAGDTVRWKVVCTGRDAMSGSGQLTKTARTMKGVVKLTADGEQMTQNIDGKLVGTCSAAAQQKKFDAMAADAKQKSDAAVRQTCETLVDDDSKSGGTSIAMYQDRGLCAAYQTKLCTQSRAYVATYKGYLAYLGKPAPVTGLCHIDLNKQGADLCRQAITDKAYRFIGGHCPAQSKALADKYCKGFGMDVTADLHKPNADMCIALLSNGNAGSDPDGSDAAAGVNGPADKDGAAADAKKGHDNPATKAMESVKKLKDLFKH